MSGELRAAYTKLDETYPGYINVSENESGITIVIRGDPKKVSGSLICGYARDYGQPGRCTPGDELCNNYCNHDTSQPMPDRPGLCEQTLEGPTAQVTFTHREWQQIARQLKVAP